MLLCGGALLCGSAAIFNPASLQAVTSPFAPAAPGGNNDFAPAFDNHQEFANTLAQLVGRCQEVIAIHDRGRTPYSELVLWVEDRANPGVIDQTELAIISHSQLFRTVAVYGINSCGTMDENEAAPVARRDHTKLNSQQLAGGSVSGARRSALSAIDLNDRQALREPSFCDTWRGLSQVKPCVIATGVSDLRLHHERNSGAETENTLCPPPFLRLSLTWSADSVDGAGEASAVVKVPSLKGVPSQE